MPAVDILINNAGLALGVATAIEPLADWAGLRRYLDPKHRHTDSEASSKCPDFEVCLFWLNLGVQLKEWTERDGLG